MPYPVIEGNFAARPEPVLPPGNTPSEQRGREQRGREHFLPSKLCSYRHSELMDRE